MSGLLVAIALSVAAVSPARGGESAAPAAEHVKSVTQVMTEIRQSQGLTGDIGLDPDKVSDYLLEELGSSVMEERLGNPGLRVRMDSLMGGSGSATAALLHRQVGYNYLHGGRGELLPGVMGRPYAVGEHPMAGERYWLWGIVVMLVFILGGALIVLAVVALRRTYRSA